jgi:hypothetical protein
MKKRQDKQIGDVFTTQSELYGLITYITVAKVNLLHPDDPQDFLDHYTHPRKVFSAFSTRANPDCFKTPDDKTSQFAYFLSLPFDIANQNWWSNNPDCGYRSQVKRKPRHTSPPVHATLKQYERWQVRNQPALETWLTRNEIEVLAPNLSDLPRSDLFRLCLNP